MGGSSLPTFWMKDQDKVIGEHYYKSDRFLDKLQNLWWYFHDIEEDCSNDNYDNDDNDDDNDDDETYNMSWTTALDGGRHDVDCGDDHHEIWWIWLLWWWRLQQWTDDDNDDDDADAF